MRDRRALHGGVPGRAAHGRRGHRSGRGCGARRRGDLPRRHHPRRRRPSHRGWTRARGHRRRFRHRRCSGARVRSRRPHLLARYAVPHRHRRCPHFGVTMIPRYSLPEMATLFTDEARFGAWLEVEILAVEAWAELGVVPQAAAVAVRERAGFDVAAIAERELVTEHDVAAFVDVVQEHVGQPEGTWVHYGLTSSDVVDTALSLQLTRAVDLLIDAAVALDAAITQQ